MDELFPTIFGKNLNKEKKAIPDDFLGIELFVIVAFQRWHQNLVDEAISNLEKYNIENTHYIIEVPVVSELSLLRRMRLNAIMRAGITDFATRQRTITVYTDKEGFKRNLGIPDEEKIHWFIVDPSTKKIRKRGTGVISPTEISNFFS